MNDNDNFSVNIQRHQKKYSMTSPHKHNYYELFFLTKGNCELLLDNKKYQLKANSLAIIPPNIIHMTKYNDKTFSERICVEFTEQYISMLNKIVCTDFVSKYMLPKVLLLSPYLCDKLKYAFQDIIDNKKQLEDKKEISIINESLIRINFWNILLYLVSFTSTDATAIQGIPLMNNSLIQQAISYINNNYYLPLTLTGVAALLHVNSSYLSKLFKQSAGICFKEYLTQIRINEAKELLVQTNQSITEIAFSSGFITSNYFGDCFKKKEGISPREYRNIKKALLQ